MKYNYLLVNDSLLVSLLLKQTHWQRNKTQKNREKQNATKEGHPHSYTSTWLMCRCYNPRLDMEHFKLSLALMGDNSDMMTLCIFIPITRFYYLHANNENLLQRCHCWLFTTLAEGFLLPSKFTFFHTNHFAC